MTNLHLDGLTIEITRKKVKGLRLSIHPPHAQIKVSAPIFYSLEKIKNFILKKIGWLKKHQTRIRNTKYVAPLKVLDGEFHYFFGEKYLLKIFEKNGAAKVFLKDEILELHARKNLRREKRQAALDQFYRASMKKIIPKMISTWEKELDVKVKEFGIKKMKTRWGTCNPRAARIWLNLELAKLPQESLDYIILHEMVHLLERNHSKKFYDYMDRFMPDWRARKEQLKHLRLH